MKEADGVTMYAPGMSHTYYPAVNVKYYRQYGNPKAVAERFGCSVEQAQKALEFCFESAQQQFWDDVENHASELFPGSDIASDGRSGGWLLVRGLDDLEEWDKETRDNWTEFESAIRDEIKYLESEEYIFEQIQANEWARANSRLYNFMEVNGRTLSVADRETFLQQCAKLYDEHAGNVSLPDPKAA